MPFVPGRTDLVLRLPPASGLKGTLLVDWVEALPLLEIRLVEVPDDGRMRYNVGATAAADGTFGVAGLSEGDYSLEIAQRELGTKFSEQLVRVAGEATVLPPIDLRGRVALASVTCRSALDQPAPTFSLVPEGVLGSRPPRVASDSSGRALVLYAPGDQAGYRVEAEGFGVAVTGPLASEVVVRLDEASEFVVYSPLVAQVPLGWKLAVDVQSIGPDGALGQVVSTVTLDENGAATGTIEAPGAYAARVKVVAPDEVGAGEARVSRASVLDGVAGPESYDRLELHSESMTSLTLTPGEDELARAIAGLTR